MGSSGGEPSYILYIKVNVVSVCVFVTDFADMGQREWKVLKKHPSPPLRPKHPTLTSSPVLSLSFPGKEGKKKKKKTNGGWVSGWVGLEPGLNQLPTLVPW